MRDEAPIVIALGGNAISRESEEGNVDQQFANSRLTAKALADLVVAGHRLVITHGNGPQIGNFLLRNEAAAGVIYPLPMEVAVAHVQGGMGFMIAQTLTNELNARGRRDVVTAIVTSVEVDQNDPSFREPSKPVGRTLSKEEASRFRAGEGWDVKEMSPGKWRRVVPSPIPRHILEIDSIHRAVDAGDLVIACGGGGIPVVRYPQHGLRGVRAVIDKDLASALLAAELNASAMIILTAVDRVCINYGTADQKALDKMTVTEAQRHLDAGQFPAGSMGPKVQAAINFVRGSRRADAFVVIGPLDHASAALSGKVGTRITGE